MQDPGFTEEQKQYLEGFISALIKKRGAELPTPSPSIQPDAQTRGSIAHEQQLGEPAYIHLAAQDRWMKANGSLPPEELAKRAKHPFDMWDEMLANAAAGPCTSATATARCSDTTGPGATALSWSYSLRIWPQSVSGAVRASLWTALIAAWI